MQLWRLDLRSLRFLSLLSSSIILNLIIVDEITFVLVFRAPALLLIIIVDLNFSIFVLPGPPFLYLLLVTTSIVAWVFWRAIFWSSVLPWLIVSTTTALLHLCIASFLAVQVLCLYPSNVLLLELLIELVQTLWLILIVKGLHLHRLQWSLMLLIWTWWWLWPLRRWRVLSGKCRTLHLSLRASFGEEVVC